MENSSICLNCKQKIGGGFCSNCGQKTNLTPIKMKDIGREFISSIFNYEGPFPLTFTYLFYDPRKPIQGFLRGERKKYYPPVRYLLVCLAVSLLVTELFDYDPIVAQMGGREQPLDKVNGQWVEAGHFLHRHINYFIFFFPFSVALITKLFYWRKEYGFAERVVLGFYLAGQFLIISSIMIPFIVYFPSIFNWNTYIIFGFLTFAFFRFFQPKNSWLGILQAMGGALISFLVYVILSFFLAYFIIKYKN